jgi:hypothetical protein
MRGRLRALLIVPALLAVGTAPDPAARAAQAPDAPGSLCATSEVVIFHCGIGRKMVSVCGGRRPTPHAQYRFGSPGDIELAVPGAGQSGLTWAREMYSGGGALQLRFSNGGYDYAVYSRTVRSGFSGRNNPRFTDGVMVRQGGRLVANRLCTTPTSGDALPEEFMSAGGMLEFPD